MVPELYELADNGACWSSHSILPVHIQVFKIGSSCEYVPRHEPGASWFCSGQAPQRLDPDWKESP